MLGTTQTLSYWSLNNKPTFSQVTEQVQRGEGPVWWEACALSHCHTLSPSSHILLPNSSTESPKSKPEAQPSRCFSLPRARCCDSKSASRPFHCALTSTPANVFPLLPPSQFPQLGSIPAAPLPTTGLLSRAYKGSPNHHAVSDPVNPNCGAFRF